MESKRSDCVSFLAFFRRNDLLDREVNETVATIETWSGLWKTGAMEGVPPFVKNLVVFKCSN